MNQENEAVVYELSFCFEISNRTKESIAYFGNFLDKNPYSKAAWFNLGIAYNNTEEYDKAIEAYDFAIAIDDSFASAYFNKANSYANLNLYEKAIVPGGPRLNLGRPEDFVHEIHRK